MGNKLSPKRGLFIHEYLVDGNATRAAMAAGYSEKAAPVTGARLLKDPEIAAVIEARQQKRVAKLEITADRVLEELAKLAFYDPGALFDAEGNVRPVHKLDEMTRAAIAGVDAETTVKSVEDGDQVTSVRTTVRKFRLADKGQNLERLGRYFKLFTDRVEGDLAVAAIKLSADERAARVEAILKQAASRVKTKNAA